MSYRELNRRANQLGHYLQGLGVGPEVMVGVCLERSMEMVVALMGVLKAGRSLSADGSELSGAETEIHDGECGRHRSRRTERESEDAQDRALESDGFEGEWEEVEPCQTEIREAESEDEDLAYVIYTSGSTGEPKGVMVVTQKSGQLAGGLAGGSFGFEAGRDALPGQFLIRYLVVRDIEPAGCGREGQYPRRERILEMRELLEEMKNVSVVHKSRSGLHLRRLLSWTHQAIRPSSESDLA